MAQVENRGVSSNNNPDIFAKPMASPFDDGEFLIDDDAASVSSRANVSKERRGLDLGVSLMSGYSGDDPAVGGAVQLMLPRFELARFGSHGGLGVKTGIGFSAMNIFRSREYSYFADKYEDTCNSDELYNCSEANWDTVAASDPNTFTAETYDISLRLNALIHIYTALGRMGPGVVEFSYGPEISGEFYQRGLESQFNHNIPLVLSGGFTYAIDNGWAVNLGIKADIIDLADTEGFGEFNDRRMILGQLGAAYRF